MYQSVRSGLAFARMRSPGTRFAIRDLKVQHKAPEFLPEVERTPSLFAGLSEQPAASLFDLIDEECEHHEVGEDGR